MRRSSKRASAEAEPGGPVCRRCGAPATWACAYEDRRGQLCATDWCDTHIVPFSGLKFCPRHASTVRALGEQGLDRGLVPETDNRIPSLLATVVDALQEDIRGALLGRCVNAGEHVVEAPISVVMTRRRSVQRRWERSWKIASHTGISNAVSLSIAEDSPFEVVLRIDGHILAEAVPAWIADRGRTSPVAAEEVQRARFYGLFRAQIASALPALPRPRTPHRPWWKVARHAGHIRA